VSQCPIAGDADADLFQLDYLLAVANDAKECVIAF